MMKMEGTHGYIILLWLFNKHSIPLLLLLFFFFFPPYTLPKSTLYSIHFPQLLLLLLPLQILIHLNKRLQALPINPSPRHSPDTRRVFFSPIRLILHNVRLQMLTKQALPTYSLFDAT